MYSYPYIKAGETLNVPLGTSSIYLICDGPTASRVSVNKGIQTVGIFQTMNEVHSKNGTLSVIGATFTNVAAGSAAIIGFQTGNKPVIIKDRYIGFNGSTQLSYAAYEDSTYTASATAIVPYCQNRRAPITPLYTACQTPTSITNGTQYLPTFQIYGSGQNHNSRVGGDLGTIDTILKPNTKHIWRADNTGTGTASIFLRYVIYEGNIDIDFPY